MSKYIDADLIVYDHAVARSLDDGHNWNELVACKDQIDDIPTVDVVEVKHGEWIPNRFKTLREDGWCECSVCGVGNKLYNRGIRKSDVPYIDGKPYELKNIANYCPNCGARMREKR